MLTQKNSQRVGGLKFKQFSLDKRIFKCVEKKHTNNIYFFIVSLLNIPYFNMNQNRFNAILLGAW